jgi:uncharacterized protein YjbJ (UPF0337 family)
VNDVILNWNCVTDLGVLMVNFTILKSSRKELFIMNKIEAQGNWNELKGKLKQKFAVLTDNDLMFEEGKKEEMIGKLQITLGIGKEELHKIIGKF